VALLCLVASISSCFASPTESEKLGLDEIAIEMHESYNYGIAISMHKMQLNY
jgi:hypothetical protein